MKAMWDNDVEGKSLFATKSIILWKKGLTNSHVTSNENGHHQTADLSKYRFCNRIFHNYSVMTWGRYLILLLVLILIIVHFLVCFRKVRLLIIGKAMKPRCFAGLSMSKLPVDYRSNAKAWITAQLFEDWLRKFDHKMSNEQRKVLLFIDNAPSHPDLWL